MNLKSLNLITTSQISFISLNKQIKYSNPYFKKKKLPKTSQLKTTTSKLFIITKINFKL